MNKRGQMEIMGLAVIVILVVIGIFLAIRFLSKPSDSGPDLMDKKIATSFLNTLLADKLEARECKNGVELKEMLQDCTEKPELMKKCTAPVTYCAKAQEITKGILSETFKKRGKGYEFRLQRNEGSAVHEIMSDSYKCPVTSDKQQVNYEIPTQSGTISLILKMCN